MNLSKIHLNLAVWSLVLVNQADGPSMDVLKYFSPLF